MLKGTPNYGKCWTMRACRGRVEENDDRCSVMEEGWLYETLPKR